MLTGRANPGRTRRTLALAGATILLLSRLVSGCHSPTGVADALEAPKQTGDGWATASLQSVGMDPQPLRDLLRLVHDTPEHRIHGLLIVKDGKLVLEGYWRGTDLVPATLEPVIRDFDRNTLHYVASVSKSITSALAGIAMDRGFISGVDGLLSSWFPEHDDLGSEGNEEVTLRHVLSFSSGYEWNEFVYGFDDPRDSHNQMFAAADPVRYLLGRPMETTPGAVFHYNSGDTNLLGEIVRRASGSPTLLDFAGEALFDPLGIEDYEWLRFPRAPEVTFASGGASLRPRDMAKIGALYLHGGIWNGTRILSQEWVDTSVAMAVPLPGSYRSLYGYGFNWWLGRSAFRGRTVEYFRAAGWGGQYIFVYPELDLVLVFTGGGYYDARPLDVNDMIEDYILQAIVQ